LSFFVATYPYSSSLLKGFGLLEALPASQGKLGGLLVGVEFITSEISLSNLTRLTFGVE